MAEKRYGDYDVVVAGGGIAGISAALAGARCGARTLLLERTYLLGGLATSGLVTIFLPLCDGRGRQVSFGIAEELLRLSVKYGCEDKECPAWLDGAGTDKTDRRFEVQFNASLFALLCEKLLKENGADILYGTTVCATRLRANRLEAVEVENKSGRSAIAAKAFVDATGDADLFAQSGAGTVAFTQGNLLASWYYEVREGRYALNILGFADVPDKYKDKKDDAGATRYGGLDAGELSVMTEQAHRCILDDFLSKGGITPCHALGAVATIPQVRMTRRADGLYTLRDDEAHRRFPDSIGMISDWRKPGPVYEIPFRCLYGKDISNLYAAGRCISVTDDMWDISRAIPGCAVTGQAAGTAAALSDDAGSLDTALLGKRLIEQGVRLHLD